jgi:phosphohistidine phosphatase SixA
MYRNRIRTILPLVGLLAAGLLAPAPVAAQATDGSVVIAVRHAERADDGTVSQTDPNLSAIGEERARCLARTLEHAGITRIFSTAYRRTMETAAPVAELLGLEVEDYDPRALEEFAGELRGMGGVILVVGHSNTTPGLVEALGGDPVSPIGESEYERLYTVFAAPGDTRSTLTRFCPAA